jgi:hypothetical protein
LALEDSGVELMAGTLKGETDIPKSIAIKAVIVDKTNVDEYIKSRVVFLRQ